MKIALVPGSFDPITLGHCDIIQRTARICDKVVVVIAENPHKNYWLSSEQRQRVLLEHFADNAHVEIQLWAGPITELSKSIGAQMIVKGIRNTVDFQYEEPMAFFNRHLDPLCETLYMPCRPEFAHLSSSAVRQLYNLGQDLRPWVPQAVIDLIHSEVSC